MRIDLQTGGNRPRVATMALKLVHAWVGVDAGPPTVLSYRLDFFPKALADFVVWSAHGAGGWTKGETEMFSTFVSKQNACNF